MRKNFGAKPFFYPMPVLIVGTYGEDGTPDAMNAAWGCVCAPNQVSLFLNPGHRSVKNLLAKGAFTVSMANVKNVVAADYVGIVSANDVPNKLEKTGWHLHKSEFVDAPVIEELPLTLECKLVSYDPKTTHLVGEIVNVSADESVLNEKGRVDPALLEPISYDPVNNKYLRVSGVVGDAFGGGAVLK